MNIPAFLVYCAIMAVTPGPNNLMSLYLGASGGSRFWRFFAGSMAGLFVKCALCGLLNVLLAEKIPALVPYLKWLGALYMLYLAFGMVRSRLKAIKNNVLGTWKIVQAADRYGVKKFVMISTDKAVNPTNIMGASKRICEMIIQTYNRRSKTDFVAVRFGNVLGSNGSVIPLFKKQIERGGPVTVTHPDIVRYFMTIPEAVSLVLQAGTYAKGGEIFVLDMGEPVKILDLAKNLILLSGHKPDEDIHIIFTGLRPGEKLYEEMLMDEEGMQDTANNLIHIGRPIELDEEKIMQQLEELKEYVVTEPEDIRECVKKIVPTYHPELAGENK